MVRIATIVGGAFGVVRDRPLAVLAWAGTYVAGLIALTILMGGLFWLTGAPPTRDAPGAGSSALLQMLLFYCGYLLLLATLVSAVFRSVLRPAETRFASLRLGRDEFRMMGLFVLLVIGTAIVVLLSQLFMLFFASVMALLTGNDPGALAKLGNLALTLAWLGGFIWITVRLSLFAPLSFHRRRISLDAAWELTRGHFWPLFLSYLIVGLLFCLLFFALAWYLAGDAIAAIVRAGDDPAAVMEARLAMARWLDSVPLGIKLLAGILWVALATIAMAVSNAMTAIATRELLAARGEPLESEQSPFAGFIE